MTLRLQTFLTGFLALLTATLLALAPAGAKPASGGYQLFEQAAPEYQYTIQLAALGNFDHHAKIAPECCNATNKTLGDLFSSGGTPRASELRSWAESQGWTASRTANGPLKYTDSNGVVRLIIKGGSDRAPGSAAPHIEVSRPLKKS